MRRTHVGRTKTIAAFHRSIGEVCKTVDLQNTLLEYSAETAQPVAMINYLHRGAPKMRRSDPRIQIVGAVCTSAAIPYFVVRHNSELSTFTVVPINDTAKALLAGVHLMSAVEFKRFQLRLRGIRS